MTTMRRVLYTSVEGIPFSQHTGERVPHRAWAPAHQLTPALSTLVPDPPHALSTHVSQCDRKNLTSPHSPACTWQLASDHFRTLRVRSCLVPRKQTEVTALAGSRGFVHHEVNQIPKQDSNVNRTGWQARKDKQMLAVVPGMRAAHHMRGLNIPPQSIPPQCPQARAHLLRAAGLSRYSR